MIGSSSGDGTYYPGIPRQVLLKKSMLKVHISLLLRCCIAALIVALWAGRIAAIYFCLNNK